MGRSRISLHFGLTLAILGLLFSAGCDSQQPSSAAAPIPPNNAAPPPPPAQGNAAQPAPDHDGYPEDWGESERETDICGPIEGATAPAVPLSGPASRESLNALMNCVRAYWNRFEAPTADALLQFKRFRHSAGQGYSSWLTPRELRARFNGFDRTARFSFEMAEKDRATLRQRFEDEDLLEAVELTRKRQDLLLRAETQIVQALQARSTWIQSFSNIDRYRFLAAYRNILEDPEGTVTAAAWGALSPDPGKIWSANPAGDALDALIAFIHPYGLSDLLPAPGQELSGLSENPYQAIAREGRTGLAVDETTRSGRIALYQSLRDQPRPELKPVAADSAATSPLASPLAVQVVFVGSGIDFAAQPELNGWVDPSLSRDFADGTLNPWLPSTVAGLNRDTELLLAYRRVLKDQEPQLLKAAGVAPGFWKVGSIREVLGDPTAPSRPAYADWVGQPAFQESIFYGLQQGNQSPGDAPSVVVSTYEAGLGDLVQRYGKPGFLKQAPWVWVIAAGPQDPLGDPSELHCLNDVPEAERPAVICVGAAKEGGLERNGDRSDVIRSAYYRGPGVDVFGYESDGECPESLNCATAAVAAAATAIRSAYPHISPADAKTAILETAWHRNISFDSGGWSRVRFFDGSMVRAAVKTAKKFPH